MKTGEEILAGLKSKNILGKEVPDTFERDSYGSIKFEHCGSTIWKASLGSRAVFKVLLKPAQYKWTVWLIRDDKSIEYKPKFSSFAAARDYMEMIGKSMCRRDDKKMEEKIAKQAEYYNRLWEVEAESLREWKAKYENGAKRDRTIGYILSVIYLLILALIFIFWWLA